MEEKWKDGGEYPNKYDRVCKECKNAIPKDGRDYFYRPTPGGEWESMCRSCMNKLPEASDESDQDLIVGALWEIAAQLKRLADQGAK